METMHAMKQLRIMDLLGTSQIPAMERRLVMILVGYVERWEILLTHASAIRLATM
jgi:hypothetical protein